jgi:hypothetical protein
MISGVGLFGTFTGLVSAFLLSPKNKEQEATLEDILVEVKALRAERENRRGRFQKMKWNTFSFSCSVESLTF